MYKVKADHVKNRLYVTVINTIEKGELAQYCTDMKNSIATLKTGFTALLNLKDAGVFTQDAVSLESLNETKEVAVRAGMSKSAMVVCSPTLKMQITRNFKNIGSKDEAFDAVEEAEAFLDR